MRFPGFIGPTYQASSLNIDAQRLINMYLQKSETGFGKEGEQYAFIGTPGLSLLATIGSGPIRGTWTATNGTLYIVSGNTFYSVNSSWAPTSIGTLLTSTGQVSMADDGYNLVIVDGTNGYNFNFDQWVAYTQVPGLPNGFSQITDPSFHGADVVAFMDGYFVFNWPGSGYFYTSALPGENSNTGQLTSPTAPIAFNSTPQQIANAEGSPDNLVSLLTLNQSCWLFGNLSTEVWFDAGNSPGMPFQRIDGAFVEYGCAAKFSPAKLTNPALGISTIFWLGQDDKGQGMVVMANGYQPMRISTHAVEQAIQGYSTISDAVGWSYQENGHNFYVLTFPTGNATWVYDATTGMWHERAYLNNGNYDRHRGICHALAYGVHVVGDYANGNIYQQSSTVYSDNGNPIPRRRRSPHLSQNLKRIFYKSLQLDIESGVGLDGTGQGTNPEVMLRWSNDGGHSWSNEIWASMGQIGQTKWRAKWNRLGCAWDRVFEVTITDPVKTIILGAEIDVEEGAS